MEVLAGAFLGTVFFLVFVFVLFCFLKRALIEEYESHLLLPPFAAEARGELGSISVGLSEGDDTVHSCWEKDCISLSTKSLREPMPSEAFTLKVMCFL